MNDERSLRAVLAATQNRSTIKSGVLYGCVSGLAAAGSIIVYDAFTQTTPAIAAITPVAPIEAPLEVAMAAARDERDVAPPVATAPLDVSADDAATAEPVKPFPVRMVEADPADTDALAIETSAGPGPVALASPDLNAIPSPDGDIVDPPRIKTVADTEIDDEFATDIQVAAAPFENIQTPAAPASSEAPAGIAALSTDIAVEMDKAPTPETPVQVEMSTELSDMRVAEIPGDVRDSLSGTISVSASLDASQASPAVQYAYITPEISLTATDAFDPELERGPKFAALVDPVLDAPSTPDLNVDPAAAFNEPLDELTTAPHARTPVLIAPAVVAVLGAEPPVGLRDEAPGEVGVISGADAGRDAARRAVMIDADSGWRAHSVAPPANPQGLPVLAIVIDEVGAYGAPVEDVAALSPMVTTSIIPSVEGSAEIAKKLKDSGREILVHMPMETYADFDEGPNPILRKMTDEEVRETALWHLSHFPGIVGVNNHLGSKVTRDQRIMGALMAELSDHGLMFLDSRTTGKSVAEQVALDAGMLATRNHRFIDNEIATEAIMRELDHVAAQARRHGAAVALGNPHPATVRAVRQWMEANDGKKVLVAPITHVASVISDKQQTVVAAQ